MKMLKKPRSLITVVALLFFFARGAFATQADDTTITITGQKAGPTPFISQLTLTASDTTVIKSIQFTITPKPGSVTRPLSGTYTQDYMISHGYLVPPSTDIFLPGLRALRRLYQQRYAHLQFSGRFLQDG